MGTKSTIKYDVFKVWDAKTTIKYDVFKPFEPQENCQATSCHLTIFPCQLDQIICEKYCKIRRFCTLLGHGWHVRPSLKGGRKAQDVDAPCNRIARNID